MTTAEDRARRCYSLNEMLLKIVGRYVKMECAKLIDAGFSIAEINARLPDVIVFYENWRSETLRQLMAEFDDLTERAQSVEPTSLKPMMPN
jgi:hypothetical protein